MLNGYANEMEHGSILKSEAKQAIYKYGNAQLIMVFIHASHVKTNWRSKIKLCTNQSLKVHMIMESKKIKDEVLKLKRDHQFDTQTEVNHHVKYKNKTYHYHAWTKFKTFI